MSARSANDLLWTGRPHTLGPVEAHLEGPPNTPRVAFVTHSAPTSSRPPLAIVEEQEIIEEEMVRLKKQTCAIFHICSVTLSGCAFLISTHEDIPDEIKAWICAPLWTSSLILFTGRTVWERNELRGHLESAPFYIGAGILSAISNCAFFSLAINNLT